MRIAICEDEEFIQNSIEKNVEKCLEITGMAGKCECFVSAEELLEKGNMPCILLHVGKIQRKIVYNQKHKKSVKQKREEGK